MEILPYLRNKVFWMIDTVKGSPVRNAYNDIKKIDSLDSDSSLVKEYQSKAWEKLKETACSNTVAYNKYFNCSFKEFPIITKQDIKRDQSDYLSTLYNRDELIKMSTSGSIGVPFISYQNKGKKKRVNAEVIYYTEKVGYELGKNLSYIRSIVKQNEKSKLKQFIQNQTLIDCKNFDDDGINNMLKSLKNLSKRGSITLLAYGSTYSAIKDYLERNNIETINGCNISGIISGSDMLFDETRNKLSKAFGNIQMVSRYSNEENGVIGQDEGINNVFVINEASYYVEILDEMGNRVPDGKIGKIVVTDFFNYAMPMIRYDTGDVGAIQLFNVNGRTKRCICKFSGRKVDTIFNTDGEPISPHTITNNMWEFTDIEQFQFIQKDKSKYLLKIIADPSFNRDGKLVNILQNLLGAEAVIHVERVQEIPLLASGKRRYIINDWKIN